MALALLLPNVFFTISRLLLNQEQEMILEVLIPLSTVSPKYLQQAYIHKLAFNLHLLHRSSSSFYSPGIHVLSHTVTRLAIPSAAIRIIAILLL